MWLDMSMGRNCSRFAVTTPWGIEFKQNIVLVIDDNILVVVRDNDLHGTLLLFGDGLRFDARFDLAVDEVLDESANVIMGNLLRLVVWIFLILGGLLDREGRPFALRQVQVGCVGAECFRIDGGEIHSALVSLS